MQPIDIHSYPIDTSFSFVLPMNMYVYRIDGWPSFILPINKYLYPTNSSINLYQWILKCSTYRYAFILFKHILLIVLSFLSFQWTNIYSAKYPIDGFSCILPTYELLFFKNFISRVTFVVSNGLTIILSPYLYYVDRYICIFNKHTSHFNNQTRMLTFMDFEARMYSNNQANILCTKNAKTMVKSIVRDATFFFKLCSSF